MSPIEWLCVKAPGFNKLAGEDRDAIMHFTLLWSFFEAKALCTSASANKILAVVKRWEGDGRLDVAAFDECLVYFRGRYFRNGTATQKFFELGFRPHDKEVLVEAVLKGENTNPSDCVAALLIVVYRLRNNLFHGAKWDYDIRDQRCNFTHANAILMSAMDLHCRSLTCE
jgi:hypothetical protein